jgi:hypothetical protein
MVRSYNVELSPGASLQDLFSRLRTHFLHTTTPLFSRKVVLRPPGGAIGAHPSPGRHTIPNHLRTTRPVMNWDEVLGGQRVVGYAVIVSRLFS